jgi:alkyl sulfatase BDS1-like metallo-beta-lactamase superfamily hydrolase
MALCGREEILTRARELKEDGELQRALALAEIAANADSYDKEATIVNAEILEAIAATERSFIARNFFAGAARQLRERAK